MPPPIGPLPYGAPVNREAQPQPRQFPEYASDVFNMHPEVFLQWMFGPKDQIAQPPVEGKLRQLIPNLPQGLSQFGPYQNTPRFGPHQRPLVDQRRDLTPPRRPPGMQQPTGLLGRPQGGGGLLNPVGDVVPFTGVTIGPQVWGPHTPGWSQLSPQMQQFLIGKPTNMSKTEIDKGRK